MRFANEDAFNSPFALQAARSNGTNGCLIAPKPFEIRPHQQLIRFGDEGLAMYALGGAWWLELSEYNRVVEFAQIAGYEIPEAIRRTCVIPTEWSHLTTMLQVQVTAPLLAYRGTGGPAMGKAGLMIAEAGIGGAINQLYIPGLGNPDARRGVIAWDGQGYF